MSESKTSERRLTAVEKQRQAFELRKAGASYAEIAKALGYAGPSGALKAVESAIVKMLQEPAEEVRKLELARLDHMLSAVWPRVSSGDGQAIDRALRIMERRAKLLGLDAPVKVNIADRIYEMALEAGLSEDDAKAAVHEADRWVRSQA